MFRLRSYVGTCNSKCGTGEQCHHCTGEDGWTEGDGPSLVAEPHRSSRQEGECEKDASSPDRQSANEHAARRSVLHITEAEACGSREMDGKERQRPDHAGEQGAR